MQKNKEKDIIIGLDSSTQSAKAIAWSREGKAVAEHRADIPMHMPQEGFVEQDINDWWQTCCKTLQGVTAEIDPARIAGVAISNQRETVGFLGADGAAVTPAMVWLDERSKDELEPVSRALGADFLHRITGKPVDITPVLYRLSWLHRHQPDVLARVAKIVDVHGYLTGRLTGVYTASRTSADPFGLFDINAMAWSETILDFLGIKADQLAKLRRPGELVGRVSAAAAKATGLAEATPVYTGGGDGQCAGLGVNAAREGVVYLNLGTAIITGAWSPEPLIDRHWRTMTSPTGSGFFLEGVQRAGAFLVNWVLDTFMGGRKTPGIFRALEEEASAIPIGSQGVLMCPYLSGCMDPHWDPDARATLTGLAPFHTRAHIYRATLESLTLEIARCVDVMREKGLPLAEIVAVGGGANSPLWSGMIADACQLPLARSQSLEASSLGAAMSAAVGLGWYRDFEAAAAGMSSTDAPLAPNAATCKAWQQLKARQAKVYLANAASA